MECAHCHAELRKWDPIIHVQHDQAQSWGEDSHKVGRLLVFDAAIVCGHPCLRGWSAEHYPDPVAVSEQRSVRPPTVVR